jgi:hypothetical protein
LKDYGFREMTIMVPLVIVIIWLGLYPQPVIDTVDPALENIQESVPVKEENVKEAVRPGDRSEDAIVGNRRYTLKRTDIYGSGRNL